MKGVYIVAAVRTPMGAFGGSLSSLTARELGVTVVKELLKRANLSPEFVDEVIAGHARQAGNGPNLARQIAYYSGIPVEKPAFTVNKACASGTKAITLAAQSIMLGENEVVVAVGVEAMSQIPYLLDRARWGYRLGDATLVDAMWRDGYFCPMANMLMGETAELLAEKYSITREEQDKFAYESHMKAHNAWETGKFKDEVVPIEIKDRKGNITVVERDERIRPDTSVEKLARLKPVFKENGTVTAGNSSGIADAAAAVLVVSEDALKKFNLMPMVRIVDFATAAVDPKFMGLGPVPATRKLLAKTGLKLEDIGLIELNEAFAVQVLAVERELNWDTRVRNVNGGAVALGHPTGCTGVRITVTLIYEMLRRGVRYGLSTLCVSGGQGMSLIVENSGC